MTDAQIVSIAITLFAIAAGALFNNVRISDSNTSLNKRFDDMRDLINMLSSKMDRIDQTLTTVTGEIEQRVRSLEQQRPR